MTNFKQQRQQMVEVQLKSRDITDQRVLEAMNQIPREKFVPKEIRFSAYADRPLSIGHHQTISQPYVVALMCQLLKLKGTEKILDVGTGSGYQAAVLSRLAKKVITIEVIPDLAKKAKEILGKLNYQNVIVIIGDGRKGSPDHAPFDKIISAAASENIPQAWKNQLKTGGQIVLPMEHGLGQKLVRVTKTNSGFKKESFGGVMFVPLVKK
jgi:protein-L-isoaspartate(D-aspartate) O-methyltransferase